MVPSLYFSFFCFLVSSVSNFHPDIRGAVVITFVFFFFRLACSVVLWGGRNTMNKYHRRVWAMLAVSGPHWACPAHGVWAFPVYTAQAPGCSAGSCLMQALGCMRFPGLKPLGFRFLGTPRRRRLGWACLSCPSQVQAARVTRSLARIVAPSWRLWLLPSLVPAFRFSGCTTVAPSSGKLISGCDPPGGWQMPTVQNPKTSWLATKSACGLV